MNTTIKGAARTEAGPVGERMSGYVASGSLRPGVGKLVQRTQQPLLCGTIVGTALMWEAIEFEVKGQKRSSIRFTGNFLALDHEGNVISGQATEAYLPGVVTRAIKAALTMNPHAPVPIAVEVWCEPDAQGRRESPLGYSYTAYNRQPRAENDATLRLAIAAGIIEAPAGLLTHEPEREPAEMIEIPTEDGEVLTMTRGEAEAQGLLKPEPAPEARGAGKGRQRAAQ